MRFRVPILLCALLVCMSALGAVPVAGQPQAGETHLEAQLQADGDAQWSVTYRVPIEDDRDREEFEAFASRFEADGGELDLGVAAFERAVDEAAEASGREMSIDSVRRDGEVITENEDGEAVAQHGVLRVEFTWESFARFGENETLYVDDAFNTTDGTWLPGLGAGQSLTIRAPPGYGGPTTSPIGADGGDLHWEGPATFEPGYFSIVYHPTTTGAPPEGGVSSTLVVGALTLSGSALFVGLYLLFARRRGGDESDEGGDGGTLAPNVDDETVATDGDRGDEETSVETTTPGLESEEPALELLSDEERVEHLLERSGGRMKQATIVKETGWSNAKVSQLLSAMDDADRVDKLRIGRENLISLPGEGVGEIDGSDEDR